MKKKCENCKHHDYKIVKTRLEEYCILKESFKESVKHCHCISENDFKCEYVPYNVDPNKSITGK